tara:strand:+ start:720 stop:1472 length:753 start_codon:yes stop_codon:yes gene_type:complete
MAVKIVQVTDLHIASDKRFEAHGVNTFQSAKNVITNISEISNLDYLIMTGDLSDDESTESYTYIDELLQNFSAPVYLIPGNHDAPDIYKKIHEGRICNHNYFVVGNWVIYMFNTKKNSSPNGLLKEEELFIFDKLLSTHPEKSFMLFTHHHPIPIGSKSMDKMMIENSHEIVSRIKTNTCIRGIAWGHVHEEFFSTINNTKFFSCPSTCYQAKPQTKKYTIDHEELPGYRIITLHESGDIDSEVIRVDSK